MLSLVVMMGSDTGPPWSTRPSAHYTPLADENLTQEQVFGNHDLGEPLAENLFQRGGLVVDREIDGRELSEWAYATLLTPALRTRLDCKRERLARPRLLSQLTHAFRRHEGFQQLLSERCNLKSHRLRDRAPTERHILKSPADRQPAHASRGQARGRL